jgi:single-strand DNA-binding protein
MSVAAVTLTGYVALEPKLWFTKQAHTPVVNLRVGMTPRRLNASTGEWKDGPSSFFTVNCWRKLALNVSASMHKGDPVIIRGQLRMRSWNDNGKARSAVEIEAESVGHDVAYGFSHFMRGVHPGLLGVLDGSTLASATGEFSVPGGNDLAGIPTTDWGDSLGQSDLPSLIADGEARSDLDAEQGGSGQGGMEQGSTEQASGSGPLDEEESDDSAGIPDGELASGGVPF